MTAFDALAKGGKISKNAKTQTVRTRDGEKIALTYTTRGAIKLYCTECMGWDEDPKNCTDELCVLYPWRGRSQKTQRGSALRTVDRETSKDEGVRA